MAWVKVPPEHHPIFEAALPVDPRVETQKMFGGIAAKVNGHLFAGLFGRSTMLLLPEPERAEALALKGASRFDPMGDGRARSDKVMLPETMMRDPAKLRAWIARAFKSAVTLPVKAAKPARTAKAKAESAKAPSQASKAKAESATSPAVKRAPPLSLSKKASSKKPASKKRPSR